MWFFERLDIYWFEIIVKNLPGYYDEAKLRKHFAEKFEVTDVKLMKKRDGTSRRFGFIGFKSDEIAEQATKYFDNSFIDTAKIEVQLAKTFSDPTVPKLQRERQSREQYERDELKRISTEEYESQQVNNNKRRKGNKPSIIGENTTLDPSDPKLNEYLDTMKLRKGAAQSWANDDNFSIDGYGNKNNNSTIHAGSPATKTEENIIPDAASDDEYATIPSLNSGDKMEEDEVMIPFSAPESKELEEKPVDETMSDFEWLKMRRTRIVENKEASEEAVESEAIEVNEPRADAFVNEEPIKRQFSQEDEQQGEEGDEELEEPDINQDRESIAKSGRLFIRNLLYSSTEDDFRQLFSKFGELDEVHIPVDKKSSKSKGFAHIQFSNAENAVAAYDDLDKQIFQGRLLHILPGQPKREHKLDEFDLRNLPLKKQNELKKRAAAAKQQFSWNSLYMNQDAVMESVAAKLGISKSELINPFSADSSVKQALAEASVITDVKSYFENKGIDLMAFNKKEKSDLVILIKNFPYGTTLDEIADLFKPFGELRKVLMPPAGTIAIVVFKNAPEARAAFSKLAFRRFKTSILYLEKGPKELFNNEIIEDQGDDGKSVVDQTKNQIKEIDSQAQDKTEAAKNVLASKEEKEEKETPASSTGNISLFVKNLNFKTTSAGLSEAFKPLNGFVVAVVKMKADPRNKGGALSMGFGFAEFKNLETATTAMNVMDGHVLDGHRLVVKLSQRKSEPSKGTNGAASNIKNVHQDTKLLVKNLPFEATRKDIQELFVGVGAQLKSVRVPKKFNKEARGFAFVELVTAKEAENAMKSLHGVHLLGRRLVIQYAQQDSVNAEEEISRMQSKVRTQVAKTTVAGMRLSGKRNFELEDENGEEFYRDIL
ncbi:hypothetical protein NADFUDRAFT_72100 [Nadsonia fulvescens var. elongata DSM 6958]|uniref:Multiple RNA-binding domain-containing protein 1 n=1 Tax=Nadsonia fulvescens var. elongata DSM 6958 TaxID=857566 RepID=A0A1E3PDG3_9ASCO|nr:hypothetical protein NADFUDRAFT_72100 [Nadsonia fulvescens var. elongata DSM 6958]